MESMLGGKRADDGADGGGGGMVGFDPMPLRPAVAKRQIWRV